jgi:pilus assembly protein TadC
LSDLDRDLYQARMPFTGKEYGVAAIGISSVLAVFSLISYALYPEYSLAIIFLVFAFSMILFFNYPKTRKKRISKEIDRDLPYALTSIGSEMNINVPFEKTIENVANSGYGEVSKEFKKVLIDIKNGFSIQESLTNFSDRIDSSFVKRAVAIIITAYGKGGRSGDLLKKLADEYNSVAQAKLREYNGKVVLYSLIFIAFSAIIPAMFQTFVIIGSSFMVLIITPEMAFWIPAAVFPVTNACILLIMRSKRP